MFLREVQDKLLLNPLRAFEHLQNVLSCTKNLQLFFSLRIARNFREVLFRIFSIYKE